MMHTVLGVASLIGAGVFFAAGRLWPRGGSRSRSAGDDDDEVAAGEQVDDLEALGRKALVRRCRSAERERGKLAAEYEHLAKDLTENLAKIEALEKESVRLQDKSNALRALLGRRRVEESRVRAALEAARRKADGGPGTEVRELLQRAATAESESERLRAALAAQRKAEQEERQALLGERDAAHERHRREQQRQHEREVREWQERLAAVEARLTAAADPEVARTLRHDLALATELSRGREAQIERLVADNASLRRDAEELRAQLPELERLRRDCAELRARALGRRSPERPRQEKRSGGAAVRALPAGAPTQGAALQRLVDKVSEVSQVRAAVVADELGLVVASHGEHGEELAAVAALFVQAGSQARRLLPLRELCRLTLEDEQRVKLSVIPLRSPDGDAADAQLSLIVLAVGAEPDAGRITTLLGASGRPLAYV